MKEKSASEFMDATEIDDEIIVEPFEGPPWEGKATNYHSDSNGELFIFSDRSLIRYNSEGDKLMLGSDAKTHIKSGIAGHVESVKNTTKNIVWKN